MIYECIRCGKRLTNGDFKVDTTRGVYCCSDSSCEYTEFKIIPNRDILELARRRGY